MDRRAFLKATGSIAACASLGALGGAGGSDVQSESANASDSPFRTTLPPGPTSDLYPADRNARYALDRRVSDETVAATYSNFYEFTTNKGGVWKLAEHMQTRPWTVRISGMVKTPKTWDIDALVRKLSIEERLYRHRCVETWAMAVPWTGFAFKALVDLVEPDSGARFVRLVSLVDRKTMPGLSSNYPWPYREALTMAEANNELAFLATGIYGHELPKQHGAPIRLVTPWKYGFKSIKSIVEIEFTEKQPETFWNQAVPGEYGFYANVNPEVAHPRWSQAREHMIGSNEQHPTLLYNGYAEQVAEMYAGMTGHFF